VALDAECPFPEDRVLVGVGVGDVGGAETTSTEVLPVIEPVVVAPGAAAVTVAASVAVSPDGAELGTAICASSSVAWLTFMPPSVQVCDPLPTPQIVKVGAGRLGEGSPAMAEICTVTSSAAPPVGHTVTLYKASCPGCTLVVSAATVTHISEVAAGVDELPVADELPEA
jgi:hypothetical protein